MSRTHQLDRLLAGIDEATDDIARLNALGLERPLTNREYALLLERAEDLNWFNQQASTIPTDTQPVYSRREMLVDRLRRFGLAAVYGLNAVSASFYMAPPPPPTNGSASA